jgi:hypothetical protein
MCILIELLQSITSLIPSLCSLVERDIGYVLIESI